MLKFLGKNTDGTKVFKADAESPIQLYYQLVSENVISTVDEDPFEKARMKKGKKTREDLANYLDDHNESTAFDDFMGTLPELTDTEILNVIDGCNGMAFYQEITMTQGDAAEELGVTRSRISALVKAGKLEVVNGFVGAMSVYQYAENRKPAGRPEGTIKKTSR